MRVSMTKLWHMQTTHQNEFRDKVGYAEERIRCDELVRLFSYVIHRHRSEDLQET